MFIEKKMYIYEKSQMATQMQNFVVEYPSRVDKFSEI